jgi:hypothetical protein
METERVTLERKVEFLMEVKEWLKRQARIGHAYVKKAKRQEWL